MNLVGLPEVPEGVSVLMFSWWVGLVDWANDSFGCTTRSTV